MSHSNTTTKSITEARNQESEPKHSLTCQPITDSYAEEQNDEMEKVCTGIYRCLLSDLSNGKKMKAQKRRK